MLFIDAAAAFPSFVITLREGVEAALVVGIVLAYLHKAEQTRYQIWVLWGVILGLLSSGGVGWAVARWLIALQDSPKAAVIQPAIVAALEVVAIALLSWMLLWMTAQAKGLKQEVQASVQNALAQKTGWGLLGLVWSAIVREGFEAVVFVLTQTEAGSAAWLGSSMGLLMAIAIGFALFRWGIRFDIGQFFRVLGVLLLLLVGGLVIGALAHSDRALVAYYGCDTTCILGGQLWDTQAWLPQTQFPGIILKTLLGYRDRIFVVQALAYFSFWLTLGLSYRRSLRMPITEN